MGKKSYFCIILQMRPYEQTNGKLVVLNSSHLITLSRKVKNALDSEGDAGVRQAGVVRHRVDVLLQVGQHGRRSPLHCGPHVLKCRKANF